MTKIRRLAVLRNRNIVGARKESTSVHYRVRDPQMYELQDMARRIFNADLIDTRSMLVQLEEEGVSVVAHGRATRHMDARAT